VRGALDVHRDLLARAVPHEVVRLPGRLLNADDLPRLLQLDSGCVAARCCVVERDEGTSFAVVLVPAGTVPVPSRLLAALDARAVTAARPEHVNAATDYAAGLVCPVGLPADVEVLADTALERDATSYCALGEGGVALGIRTADLLAVTGARRVPLTPDRTGRVIELDRPSAAPTSPQATSTPSDLQGTAGSSDVL
jgi:Cys-tRNA(Pro)/Cys-tRNA(Cys) deacylase